MLIPTVCTLSDEMLGGSMGATIPFSDLILASMVYEVLFSLLRSSAWKLGPPSWRVGVKVNWCMAGLNLKILSRNKIIFGELRPL